MRYFKISLPKDQSFNFIYPPNYKSEIERKVMDHLYWDEGENSFLLIATKDEDVFEITDGIQEISEADAVNISNAFETPQTHLNDPAKITYIQAKMQAILLKQSLGIPLSDSEKQGLTPDEEAALDPLSPVPGIVQRTTLASRITQPVEVVTVSVMGISP